MWPPLASAPSLPGPGQAAVPALGWRRERETEGALCPQQGQVGPRVPREGQIKVQIWVGEQIKETPGGDGGSASPTTYRAEST